MKASDLLPDEDLRRLIVRRYGQAVGIASGPPIVSQERLFGTKPEAAWRRPALFAVNDMRMAGATITDALRTIYREHDISRIASSSFASFKRSYEMFRKDELRDHFHACILEGDLDEAITVLKLCHDTTRQELWAELKRDSSPGPPS